MISEKEVLESLDKFGEKIVSLRDKVAELEAKNADLEQANKILAANNIDTTHDAEEFYEKYKAIEQKYLGAMNIVHHVVEETIEGKYEPLVEKLEKENKALGERCQQLQADKGNLTDKVATLKADIERLKAAADEKDKTLEAINSRLKSFSKAPTSDLDIDSMITKIHNNDVASSEVDAKLNEIKNERFTEQYAWGRATKETVNKFVAFVTRLWKDYATVGSVKILNRVPNIKEDLDENTVNTFFNYLLKSGYIEIRNGEEVISNFELDYVITQITKVC